MINKKIIIAMAVIVALLGLSSLTIAQKTEDAGAILLEIRDAVQKADGKLEQSYQNLVESQKEYFAEPTGDNYAVFKNDAIRDQKAAENYASVVKRQKAKQKELKQAEKEFYELTPAPKTAITGEVDKKPDTSVKEEMAQTEATVITELKKDIRQDGGLAAALKAQSTKLKSVKDRVIQDPVAGKLPEVKSQDEKIMSALEKAIEARRCAMYPDEKGCPK